MCASVLPNGLTLHRNTSENGPTVVGKLQDILHDVFSCVNTNKEIHDCTDSFHKC